MLMNNLDPDVAERPQDLVVYGGTGKAARDWPSFDAICRTLQTLGDDETLLVQSGKPVGVFTTHPEAPRVLIANANLVGRWATWDVFRELERLGLIMYGQMTAGSWIYIGTQGILQGTYETFGAVAKAKFQGSLRGRIVPTGENYSAAQRSLKLGFGNCAKRLVRALEDALRPDVDPGTRRHLPVHDQPAALEVAKHLPRREAAHQVCVCDQHARRIGVRRKNTHGFARLHDQRLFVAERLQCATDRVERRPIPRGLPGAAVDDEILRALCDVRVEIVHQHSQRGFLHPPL